MCKVNLFVQQENPFEIGCGKRVFHTFPLFCFWKFERIHSRVGFPRLRLQKLLLFVQSFWGRHQASTSPSLSANCCNSLVILKPYLIYFRMGSCLFSFVWKQVEAGESRWNQVEPCESRWKKAEAGESRWNHVEQPRRNERLAR